MVDNDAQKFTLQRLSDDTYIGCVNTNFSGTVSNATEENAAIFTVTLARGGGESLDPGVTNGVNTWRFKATNVTSNAYLNTQGTGDTPTFAAGTKDWSIWYAYTFTADEIEELQNVEPWTSGIEAGTPYLVKNLHKNLWLNGQQVDVKDNNNASVSVVPSIIYFEANPENENQFAIRFNNSSEGKYLNIDGGWDSAMTDNLYYWSVTEANGTPTADGTLVHFAKNDNSSHNLVCNGVAADKLHSVYTNQEASVNGTTWEIIPLSDLNIRDIATFAYRELTKSDINGYSQPLYVPTNNEQMVALAGVLSNNESTDEQIITALNGITLNFYDTWTANLQVADGSIYTIGSSEPDSRGYLGVFDGVLNTTKRSGISYDADSDDFHFIVIKIGDKTYLYNPASEQFVNAFGPDTDATYGSFANNVDHVWQVSDVPTAVEFYKWGNNANHYLALKGGLKPATNAYNTHPDHGGLTLVGPKDSGSLLAYVTVGITGDTDGNGLVVTKVGELTADELAAVKAKIEANHAALSATIASIPTIDDQKTVVNHYPASLVSEFDDKTPDHQNYVLEQSARVALTNDYVYSIEDESGKAIKYTLGGIVNEVYDPTDNAFHWQAQVAEDGSVKFVHHVDGPDTERGVSTVTLSDIQGTPDLSTLGKVGLNNQLYTIVQRGTTAQEATTGIREIGVEGQGAAVLYDLSGRRVASPVKGIYVNSRGEKILVK